MTMLLRISDFEWISISIMCIVCWKGAKKEVGLYLHLSTRKSYRGDE